MYRKESILHSATRFHAKIKQFAICILSSSTKYLRLRRPQVVFMHSTA